MTLDNVVQGLFDHAGMFPPAAKDFQTSLADAAAFASRLQRPHLVATDMVLTSETLPQLTPHAMQEAGFEAGRTCTVCLVGVPSSQAAPVSAQVAAWNALASVEDPAAQVTGLDVVLEDEADWDEVWLAGITLPDVARFVEPAGPPSNWVEQLDDICPRLQTEGAGLKWRCAGPTAVDAPTLATILEAVAHHGIAAKATQGLHHPLASEQHPFGFLSLLVALRLRQVLGEEFGHDDIQSCLKERDPAAFDFRAGIQWRNHHVGIDAIANLPLFRVGSCSLDEPDEDLAAWE